MRFAVEAWATEYGSPMELDERELSEAKIDATVEVPHEKWAPIAPPKDDAKGSVLFTDGVRRIDARVWITTEDGARPGVCASYAAGALLCDGRATPQSPRVERGLFTTVADATAICGRQVRYEPRRSKGDQAEELWIAIQDRMGELEAAIAEDAEADLVIVDGPLRGNLSSSTRVGYVKTHHVNYLPEEVAHVVGALQAGERTPLFMVLGRWGRFSWYVRLPGAEGHPWAGVVRCETSADPAVTDAAKLADQVTALLPRFASVGHKDPRAPQNLYPIAGLERDLRRRLGDPALLYRDLRRAAAAQASA